MARVGRAPLSPQQYVNCQTLDEWGSEQLPVLAPSGSPGPGWEREQLELSRGLQTARRKAAEGQGEVRTGKTVIPSTWVRCHLWTALYQVVRTFVFSKGGRRITAYEAVAEAPYMWDKSILQKTKRK